MSAVQPNGYQVKRFKSDPEGDPARELIRSPRRAQRAENELVTFESITLPSIRRQTAEDMFVFNGQRNAAAKKGHRRNLTEDRSEALNYSGNPRI